MNILERIGAYAAERVEAAKQKVSPERIEEQAFSLPVGEHLFKKALNTEELSFICECKKASPSKGVIAEDFPYLEIAKDYETAGADAISVLTEPKWFMGHDSYLKEIAGEVGIPVLRKDFTVDPYMIYEAKVLGASAVLLIVAILTASQLEDYLGVCKKLGLDAIVEAHDEHEVDAALTAGAEIIGVNNRNLKDFSVDTNTSARLRKMIPDDVIYVSESGISTAEDVKAVVAMGADAVLVGEALMRAEDKSAKLREFRAVDNR
ncbi:MAG: indole-3-glycerol phosphate synthase TrpC [Eubacterium sp.]|nr:indole-3-glycerol phosphate synthase TrpC [Eubacterium sp.]